MRRKTKIRHSLTKMRDLARLDERLEALDEVPPEVLRKRPRALRQAEKPDDTKPRKGRSQ